MCLARENSIENENVCLFVCFSLDCQIEEKASCTMTCQKKKLEIIETSDPKKCLNFQKQKSLSNFAHKDLGSHSQTCS